MKTLACKDMGIDCPHVIKGETEEEVVDKMMEHMKMEHKEDMKEMMKGHTKKEMKEMMKEKIM